MFKDVQSFHEKFLIPRAERPTLPEAEMAKFRDDFMQEELNEYRLAIQQRDMAGVLDALVDLVYVALGTADIYGLPFEDAWRAVHSANMAKVRAARPEDSKRGTGFDVVKPAGWVKPDIETIIMEASLPKAEYHPAAGVGSDA